uniref:Uncharacterized protein n=1 Tax=Tanacetum cinerariifolium TaxID=118510 RepID=A0A699GWW6_TANCI|nr:hypothetical protein [Tanacetum cinerariifolium]
MIVINEASIRHDLRLNDAEGTSCLSNAVIFKELARMGITMASAIICLANNQHFNFSKYILDNLKKNLEDGVPFYMFLRFIQEFMNHQLGDVSHHKDTPIPDAPSSSQPYRKHKPKRKGRKGRKETEVSSTEIHIEDHVPTTSNDLLPSAIKETIVDKEESSKQGSKISDINVDAEIIVDEVSTAGGKLNDANEEPVKDKGKAKLVEESKIQKSRKDQIVIDKEVARRIEAEWNANMKYNTNWNEEGIEMDAERIKAPRKRIRKEKVEKDQTIKKQKGNELEHDNTKKQKLEEQQEAEELKKNLEIVPDDEDDVFVNVTPLSSKPLIIMDYKIYKEGKKEQF